MKQEKETKARIVRLLHAMTFASFVMYKNKKFNRKLQTHIFLKKLFFPNIICIYIVHLHVNMHGAINCNKFKM